MIIRLRTRPGERTMGMWSMGATCVVSSSSASPCSCSGSSSPSRSPTAPEQSSCGASSTASTRASERPSMHGEGVSTLVIGDSWSVGLGLDDLSRSWPSQLPGEVRVAGFSGSGFSARASGCGRVSFADRAPTAVSSRPDLVVVEGGLNDYDQPASATERGFRDLMRALAGQHVVVVGPASRPGPRPRRPPGRRPAGATLRGVRRPLRGDLRPRARLPRGPAPPHRGRARAVRRGGGRAPRGRDADPARGARELSAAPRDAIRRSPIIGRQDNFLFGHASFRVARTCRSGAIDPPPR